MTITFRLDKLVHLKNGTRRNGGYVWVAELRENPAIYGTGKTTTEAERHLWQAFDVFNLVMKKRGRSLCSLDPEQPVCRVTFA